MTGEPVVIDKTRVVGDLLFATQRERAVYIGTSLRDRPRWLREHPGRWWYIEDLQREAAPPGPPLESEIDLGPVPAGPNAQTSSRADSDDEDDAGLVDIPAGDHSPPHQPTSLPTPMITTTKTGTPKAELPRGAKVAMSEAEGPKTETTPLAAMGRKRAQPARAGRSDRGSLCVGSATSRPKNSFARAHARGFGASKTNAA